MRLTTTVTLPAYWASALINGCYDSLDEAEAARCEATINQLADEGWAVVSCDDESRFTWNYKLYDTGADCDGGDVLTYTLIKRRAV